MSFSPKQKLLAITPKITGTLSFLGSSYIFQDVVRIKLRAKNGGRPSTSYHSLMLGLSTFDIMASVCNVMSTWPIPRETKGVFLASGTQGTCTAQGFFAEVGNVCTPLYNAALCLYYVLVIRCGWSEAKIASVQLYFHVLPLTLGWAMGFLGLVFDLYNMSGWLCWFAPLPATCHIEGMGPCVRGELAPLFRWIHYGIIWSAIIFVTVGMLLIYLEVLSKERATKRYVDRGASMMMTPEERAAEMKRQRKRSKARKVAHQSMLFVSALYLTWIFTTLTRIFQIKHGKTYYPLLVLMAIFFPLQGLFNAIIYLRPRYLKCRNAHPELSFPGVVWKILCATETDRESTLGSLNLSSVLRRGSTRVSTFVASVGSRVSSDKRRRSVSGSDEDRSKTRGSLQAAKDAAAAAAALAKELANELSSSEDDNFTNDGGRENPLVVEGCPKKGQEEEEEGSRCGDFRGDGLVPEKIPCESGGIHLEGIAGEGDGINAGTVDRDAGHDQSTQNGTQALRECPHDSSNGSLSFKKQVSFREPR